MDIHKPKAAHSIREFLIEIGTIICGILIALGLEQVVEWGHTEHELAETRRALNTEIAHNSTSSVTGVAEVGCLRFAFDRYIAWAKGGDRPGFAPGLYPVMSSTAWDASRSGPVLRMPTEERLKYAEYYTRVANINSIVMQLREQAIQRERYTRLDRLDAEQSKRLIESVNGAKSMLIGAGWNEVLLTDAARRMGVEPSPVSPPLRGLIERSCSSVGAPAPTFEIQRDTSAYVKSAADAMYDQATTAMTP
jgi:hypothetical protein